MKAADLTKRPPPFSLRTIFKLHSTRALAFIVAAQGVVALFDRESPLPFLSHHTWGEVGSLFAVLLALYGIVGRFVDQTAPEAPAPVADQPPQTMFADSLPSDSQAADLLDELHQRIDR